MPLLQLPKLPILLTLVLCLVACDVSQQFMQLGKHLASPIDVAVADTGAYFYVINADHDRTYDQGSILVVSETGKKLRAIPTPRLASSISVAGDNMLVTFMQSTESEQSEVHRYSIQTPAAPQLKKRWQVDCLPLQSVQRVGYRYFFVGCTDGTLLRGDYDTDTLRPVRKYHHPRRAMYLDTEQGLLLAFPTSLGQPVADRRLEDSEGASGEVDNGSTGDSNSGNFVPDVWEKGQVPAHVAAVYQFAIYDIKADTRNAPVSEMHWLTYDSLATAKKYYRTSFWHATPDPDGRSSFYLSQRGALPTASHSANNVVKVIINSDLRTNGRHALTFEQAVESPHKLWYPSHLVAQRLDNIGNVLFIGSLRDRASWPREDTYSSIVVQTPAWQSKVSRGDGAELGAFAVNARGIMLTVAFFSNRLRMFKLAPTAEEFQEIILE
ncbi:MAG: hypothetical protein OYH77_05945 [Pseudomonadota bacterium]|nr:hypothetical protein [Pseudomonadota bacterium]